MKRNIIHIDESKCNGCGLCVDACHEGALQMIDGKAKLITDAYCDGLGDCLPECPTGAITIEEREAEAYDEEAVKARMEMKEMEGQKEAMPEKLACGCPGTRARMITKVSDAPAVPAAVSQSGNVPLESQLRQWPCQIKLVPVGAPYLNDSHLLIAADCAAYAYANIHQDFMRNKITLIGCPKLDEVDYSEKLTAILKQNNIKSITVLRMEVPCCGGLTGAVTRALSNSGKMVPWQVVTISTDGRILED